MSSEGFKNPHESVQTPASSLESLQASRAEIQAELDRLDREIAALQNAPLHAKNDASGLEQNEAERFQIALQTLKNSLIQLIQRSSHNTRVEQELLSDKKFDEIYRDKYGEVNMQVDRQRQSTFADLDDLAIERVKNLYGALNATSYFVRAYEVGKAGRPFSANDVFRTELQESYKEPMKAFVNSYGEGECQIIWPEIGSVIKDSAISVIRDSEYGNKVTRVFLPGLEQKGKLRFQAHVAVW